jgi:lysophospholipase L1-like esterase
MRRGFVSVCLLMVFGLALGIFCSEVLVRAFVPLSDFLWQWDPLIGMKLIPGKRGRAVKPDLYDVFVEVNSAGFRDREHVLHKPVGVRRVALLGDSVVEALQVPFGDSITPLIENGLQAAGIQSEAINFGVSGAGTAREYLTVRSYALKYRPDLILLFFSRNDFGDNTRELKGLSDVPYPQTRTDGSLVLDQSGHPLFTSFVDQRSRLAFVTNVLRDYSKTYRLIREAMGTLPPLDEILSMFSAKSSVTAAANPPRDINLGLYEIYRTQLKPQWAKGWRVTEELLVALRDLARENHIEFAVVMVPEAWEVYPQLWEGVLDQTPGMRAAEADVNLPARNLNRFLFERHVYVIDLLPGFRARAATSAPLYLRGDGHWTAAGHQLAAELISRDAAKILRSKPDDLTSANLKH